MNQPEGSEIEAKSPLKAALPTLVLIGAVHGPVGGDRARWLRPFQFGVVQTPVRHGIHGILEVPI